MSSPSAWSPVVLGRGVRLLDGLDPGSVELEIAGVLDAPGCHASHVSSVK